MNSAELITFCLLSGNVEMNKRLTRCNGELSDNYVIRMMYRGKRVMFQYHKVDDDITFIKGSLTERDPDIGITLSEIHGFKHLMKTLNIDI